MSHNEPSPQKRGHFDGTWQVFRYNWPKYAVGGGVVSLAAALAVTDGLGQGMRTAIADAGAVAGFWMLASLVASHWIYDRSELHRWTWIPSSLPEAPRRWLNLHAGLDESSSALRQLFPASEGVVVDFFDPLEMPKPSLSRARAIEAGQLKALRASHRHLPFSEGAFDATFLLFAAHELRRPTSREAFFRELHRTLRPGGWLVLVEHARDLANFAAFGPGFLHFLPVAEWRRLGEVSGLKRTKDYRMTPFVRVLLFQNQP